MVRYCGTCRLLKTLCIQEVALPADSAYALSLWYTVISAALILYKCTSTLQNITPVSLLVCKLGVLFGGGTD